MHGFDNVASLAHAPKRVFKTVIEVPLSGAAFFGQAQPKDKRTGA
jgi:hypothetical protein